MKKIYILTFFVFLFTSMAFAMPVSKEAAESKAKIYKQNVSKVLLITQKTTLKSVDAKSKKLEKITLADGGSKEFTYNEQGLTVSYKNYKPDESTGEIVLSENNTISYDSHGNKTHQIFNTRMNGELTTTEKDEFEYDSQNRETLHLFSEYSFDYSLLIKSSKTITSYQANGFKIEEYGWDEATQTWSLDSKSEIELKDNRLFKGTMYAKSEDTGEVVKSMIMEYSYNDNGNLKQIMIKAVDSESGLMVDFMKSEMTYDSNGNEVLSVDSMFDSDSGTWMEWSKTKSTYNSNNVLTSDEYYSLNWMSLQLSVTEKHEYSYTNGQLTQELVWEDLEMDGELSQSYKFEYAYDNSINIEDVNLPDSWIEHNDFNDTQSEFIFSFGALSNVKWYHWDYETGALKQYRDATYHYSNASGEVAVNNVNISNFKVGPNPFNNAITVSPPENENTLISVYNITGQLVYNNSTNISKTINTSTWKSGIYILHINFGNGTLQKIKLVKK
jgi:hypothetical protein